MMFTMDDLAGRRVVVMGLGRFGGGAGVARFCAEQGADVLVTDPLDEAALAESIAKLADLPIDYRLGEHREADFRGADLVVVNPAVDRRSNRYIDAAVDAGVRLTSEIRMLVERLPNRDRTIGVTGTAGKSTTVAMIQHILDHAPGITAWLGGNIGGSLLADLPRIGKDDWVALELSSFMLEDLAGIEWSPRVAVVTNLSPNPLDRHGTMDAYIAAKQAILRHQTAGDVAILGPTVADWPTRGRTIVVDQPFAGDLLVPGRHNRMNAAMALRACESAIGHPRQSAIASFRGLPHRLRFVVERDGVRFFNDSKSTTPESAMLAIDSFPPRTVHVILGGYDKQADLTELAHHAAEHGLGIYTIGDTGEAIADAADKLVELEGRHCRVERCETLDRAVNAARRLAKNGEVILLSPGCASWDQFTNYQQRGERFVEMVGRDDQSMNGANA